MKYFAKIENNIVVKVVCVNDKDCENLDFPQSETVGKAFIASLGLSGEYVESSPTKAFHGLPANIGYTWDGLNFNQPLEAPYTGTAKLATTNT